jgi:excisionase family DNA binding protein
MSIALPDRNAARALPRLATADQVAKALEMTPRWVLAEARAGRLPCVRLGRAVRFDTAEVAAFVAERHLDGRVEYPNPVRDRASRKGSRRRVPTVTPPAALYPVKEA